MKVSVVHRNLLNTLSWVLNILTLVYFSYISWWAAVDFNGFTSMIFGIPTLVILLACAYLAAHVSGRHRDGKTLSNYASRAIFTGLALFYLSGFFSSLETFTNLPIKIASKVSKICTGKTPSQLINPAINNS